MKKMKHFYSLILVISVLMIGTVVHAEENPIFGDLNTIYKDWLQQVYVACAANNYAVAQTFDGSDMSEALVSDMNAAGLQSYYCIFDGTADTGKGVGVYITSTGYYFYYGDYVNGLRQGTGVLFYDYSIEDPLGIHYYSYTGTWSNDKPNGTGTVRFSTQGDLGYYIVIRTGNYKDGLENGIMVQYSYDGVEFGYFTWSSAMGTPKFTTVTFADVDRALLEIYESNIFDSGYQMMPIQVFDLQGNPIVGTVSCYTETPNDYYEYGTTYAEYAKELVGEGKEIIALQAQYHYYDEYENTVYPIDYDGYYYYWWYTVGTKMGVFGFTE